MLKTIRKATRTARRLLGVERGTALVAALGIMIAVTTFGIAITAGVSSNFGQSNRDQKVKRAFATAEAGVQEARYRMNMLQPTSSNPCVTLGSGTYVLTSAPGEGQWCSEETVTLGNGNTATYQISPYIIIGGVVTRSVVSTGTVNGVTRRIKATASANTGAPLFSPFAVASDGDLTMTGDANINGSVRSNGDINMTGNSTICGETASATPGPGHSVNLGPNSEVCGPTDPAESEFVLNQPDQGDAPTNNDNDRIDNGLDPGHGFNWNPGDRELSLDGNDTLNLTGHTYSFCKLTLSGHSQLTVEASAIVRIFIDSTANCGYSSPSTEQLSISGTASIVNTSQDPTHLQIYMMGGTESNPNKASLSGGASTTELVLYAPYTNLTISGNGSFTGAIVAKKVTFNGNGGTIGYDSRVETIDQTTIGVYRSQKLVECTPTNTGSTPDSGC